MGSPPFSQWNTPMPTIREARVDDLEAVLRISNWAATHTAANFAIDPEPLVDWQRSWADTHRLFPWLVAEVDGAVAGFAKAGPHRSRCAYAFSAETTVYIDPAHHGRGLGRGLYARLIPILRAQGYRTLLAGITLPNPASVRLHAAAGFRRVGCFEKVGWKFGRFHDVSYWQLDLTDDPRPPASLRPVAEVYDVATADAPPGKSPS